MCAAYSATAYAGAITVGSVLKTAKAAIDEQSGAHVVSVASSSSSSDTEKVVADVGASIGSEAISQGKADLAVKVTRTYSYISGNSSGLTSIFGLTSAEAKKVGADWISWKSGTAQYSDLKADVTISSVAQVVPKTKGTKLSTDVTKHGKLYVLKWTTAATSSIPKLSNTLTVMAEGTALPVEETSTASGGSKVTTTFSMWGEDVLVSAPPATSTIAASKVTG
jgi:hypothetical protein